MRFAIPVADGELSTHFGHSQWFALLDADSSGGGCKREDAQAPPHEPGAIPTWLANLGVEVVIAGGMGERARALLERSGVRVVLGAPIQPPERLVQAYLEGTLKEGANACDHR